MALYEEDAKETSDVDLGVVLDGKRMSLLQFAALVMGLETVLNKKIDLIEVNLMHSWVKRNFEKDKMEIYPYWS